MADLGNLKILLDMATTGNLKSTLENVDKRLDKMREKASALKLGFDEGSVSAVSTKMRDIAEAMQEVSRNAGTKMAEGMAKSAEAAKGTTAQMQQQVSISAELEALLKEMAGTNRAIADGQSQVTNAKRSAVAAAKEEESEEQKLYTLIELRKKAEVERGQLTKEEGAVLKQMESLLRSLVSIDEQYKTNLAQELQSLMMARGITKEQLTTYQAVVTRMKTVMATNDKIAKQSEQSTRKQKQAAREREAAAKRQAQLETSIIRIETQLLGINEARLSSEAQLLVQKMRNQQITQEEVSRLSAILAQEKAIINAENQKGAATVKTNTHLRTQSRLLQQITGYLGMYFSVMGAVNLIKKLVRITGEFEAQHVALRAILHDVAGADRIFYQLQELAVKSPFTFRNLTDYAKQLSAFSVPMDEIYDTTKRLADVSAGLGVDMSRIILAYGQIRSASFLRGQEVRQLTEAGIPVLQELAKQFKELEGEAVSVGKVFDKISARQVPFEMIEKMFKDLTSEGGKFYQMQEVLADTVKGKVSNLQDAWEIMLSKVGEDNSGFIKGIIVGVTNLIRNYKELAKAIELAAIAYGTYRAAAMAAAQAESMQRIIHLATGKNIKAIPALLTKIGIGLKNIPGSIAGIVSKLNPWAIGIAAVTTAVAALIMHHREANRHIRETHKLTNEAIAKAEATKSNIEYYVKQLKAAKEGTEEYNKARQAIISNSGSYISATDAERLSLENVDQVWVNICQHIEEATKLQAMQSVTAKAEADKQEKQLNVMKDIRKYANKHKLSSAEYNYIVDYVKGNVSYEDLYYSALAQKGHVFQKTGAWKKTFDTAQRIYDESIRTAEQDLGSLYGSGKAPGAKAPAPLTEWRKSAQDYLKQFNGRTRGVTISEETNIADLAKQGAKTLNDLRDSLDLIPSTEADYKAVENDIKFWEGLSEAIYGKGKTEFSNSTKQQIKDAEALRKEQIAAIKQSVQDLKEAKRWYDQLTPLLGSKNAETLLASFNFAVPKEGFNNAFQGYADQLKAIGAENDARDVMHWANGREVGDVLNSAKAIEKYTEALQDLEAQTKRLNLSGFAQELDKIIVDADSKNRQLETNWAQKAEELEKAKDGWIQRYRVENEKATAEDAEKAWKKFYDEQTAMAKKHIDTQIEYNRKVAQEQINDKASKWLGEMMKENNIDLSDMGDKSLEQVNALIERLQRLASDEVLAGLIPDELKKDAALINVEFSKLLSTIRKTANTKLGDLSVEKMKKTLNGVKAIASTLGLNTNTSAVESSYSTLSQALVEVANAQEDVNAAMEEMDKAQDPANGIDLSKAMQQLADAQDVLAQKTENAADAQVRYNAAVAMAGVGAFASAVGNVASKMKELAVAAGNKSLSKFSDVVNAISQNLNAAAEGYAAAASAGAGAYAWIGAVIGGVADIIKQLADVQTRINKYNYDMAHAADTWALAVAQVRNEYALLQEQLDTMFGSATMSKMAGWAHIIREQGKVLQEFNSGRALPDSTVFVPMSSKAFNKMLNEAAAGLAAYRIKTKNYNWFQETFGGKEDVYQSLAELAPELFNGDGSLNFDYLDKVKEKTWYTKLSDEWKIVLDELAEANNALKDAMAEMAEYLESVFGQVGDSIADSLISAFEETGQVAFDTGDILSDVAKQFIKDWTKSFLITNYLKSLGDNITKVWEEKGDDMETAVAQSLGLLRDALSAMQEDLPYIQQFYEGLEDQVHWADGAGEEIGDAIKTAMVEQNSSLIAAYINSMRADLTMQRDEIMRNISPAVTSISTGFETHLMYMESVAGNVSNIWDRLNLLTSSGSGVKLNARI